VPAHIILSPTDNSNIINFMNFENIGVSTVKDSTAFKKIQFFSKTNPTSLFNIKSDFQNSFNKLGSLYNSDLDLNTSYNYGMDRQHNFTSQNSLLPSNSTLIDDKSVNRFFSYNFNLQNNSNGKNINYSPSVNRLSYDTLGSKSQANDVYNYYNLINNSFKKTLDSDFSFFLKTPSILSIMSAESDSKQYNNLLKYSLFHGHKKKLLWNLQFLNNDSISSSDNLNIPNPLHKFSNLIYNTENLLKFKDFKSSNMQFLGSERTVRLLNNLNSNSYK
jgi:hypothetical protein